MADKSGSENQDVPKPIDQADFTTFVEDFFQKVKDQDLENLSHVILYTGVEEHRYLTDTYHLENPSDKKTLETTVEVLFSWVTESEHFMPGETFDNKDQWGSWRVQEIDMIQDRQVSRKYFSYLLREGKWYLGMMDSSKPS